MELTTWLRDLPLDELERLARVLRAGRIGPGADVSVLRSYGLPVHWADPLSELARKGWTTDMLGDAVAAVAAARRGASRTATSLVCTRPGHEGPDLVDTSVVVRQLFRQAEREVLIAGFRVTEREMLEPLRREAWRPLDVRLFVDLDPCIDALGRKQPRAPTDTWPRAWQTQFLDQVWPVHMDPPRAWYAPSTLVPNEAGEWRSMHVKCVVVDRRLWFVTSANFTQRGHFRNIELGALIEDRVGAEEVIGCFERWVGDGVFVPLG